MNASADSLQHEPARGIGLRSGDGAADLLEDDRPVCKPLAGGIQQVAVNRTVLVEPNVDDPGRRRRGRSSKPAARQDPVAPATTTPGTPSSLQTPC